MEKDAIICKLISIWLAKYKKPRNRVFQIVVLEKTLESPLDCRRSNQSILKEIDPEYSLEGLMLKLKLQYFGHLMPRAHSLEKSLMLGKIEGRRRRGWQRLRWLDVIIDSMDLIWANSGSWWWTGKPGVLQPMGLQRVGHDWATELNWAEGAWERVGICVRSWYGDYLAAAILSCFHLEGRETVDSFNPAGSI